MGEIIMFPGRPGNSIDEESPTDNPNAAVGKGGAANISYTIDRRLGKHPSGLLTKATGFLSGGLALRIKEIMGMLSEEEKEEREGVAGIMKRGRLEETRGLRGRHEIREEIEDRWWEAHTGGDLERV